MSSKVDAADTFVKIFRSLSKYPTPTSGRILKTNFDGKLALSTSWTQRNIERGIQTNFVQLHLLGSSPNSISALPVDNTTELLTSLSPSETLKAVIKDGTTGSTKKQFVEIWGTGKLLSTIDPASLELHGDIYTDSTFGSLEWSPDETKVAFIAERKVAKSESFSKQKSQSSKETDPEKPVSRGEEYTYRPDWGEQLVDKREPVVVVHDVHSETLSLPEGIPSHYSPGQLVWGLDSKTLYGVVYENEPRRLGLIYCSNRVGFIFQLTLNGEFKLLSEAGLSVRSPRISPDGKTLVWLQRQAGGPHDGAQQLIQYDITSGKKSIVIDIIRLEDSQGFCGIFNQSLSKRCFSENSEQLIFTTQVKTVAKSYLVDLGTKVLEELPWKEDGSLSVLDVAQNKVLAVASSLNVAPRVVLFTSLAATESVDITQKEVVFPEAQIVIKDRQAKQTTDSFRYFNSLYIGPPPKPNGEKTPLIVFPHGGPHSCSINSFGLDAAFFVSIGLGVLMVNFRGSTGAGQDGVEFLPGKVSDTDVKDVHQSAEETLSELAHLDSSRVGVYGGSHGGFLSTHLSAQYPDFYKAVVARNPVIDISAMYTISDIPDWCVVEAGGTFNETKPLPLDLISAMMQRSPIHMVDRVKAPTLLLIGRKDLRVPFSQGINHYNCLRARNIPTRLNLYDDNHPLGQVPVLLDSTIHTALWFTEHLPLAV